MKLILTENVAGTGKKGQVVEVKDGYGRNLLIPKGLAIPATEGNIKRFEHIVKTMESKRKRNIQSAEEIKKRLEEATLIIRKKAGVDGKLFGSVTARDIVEEAKKTFGIEIDRKAVHITEPLKTTGAHTVTVHLEQDIRATMKIDVEKKE